MLHKNGHKFRLLLLLITLVGAFPVSAAAAEIRVAVASNFRTAMTAIAERFEATSEHRLLLASGATGKHYAQIKNGAPFDVFLAADRKRPMMLEQEGIAIPGSRFTYATGKLVLWAPGKRAVDDAALRDVTPHRVAIANPRLAPYGAAAKETLEALGLWADLQPQLVRGENIAQAFQFVHSGNATLGLVAWSQLKQPHQVIRGAVWTVPSSLYTPLEQQAVVLNDSSAVRAFVRFLKSTEVQELLRAYGYD
ncbi:MAG: molybdate ABC transporter substrate-binding protein [Gammaproteobacteria bacterium]|nr:molybdate ABC transporter substrate-binding protein [Gammaproteobacteria bacterium]